MSKKVTGWKNAELIDGKILCRGFEFKAGKSYHQGGAISLCGNGFHFHENSLDIYKYYDRKESIVVLEIEASGTVKSGDDKSVCSDIKIIRVLPDDEVKKICNLTTNTGLHNSGYMNSGYRNSGDMNSGNMNSGYMNSGYRNSGDMNSGNMNSGYWNSGDRNSGNMNSGNMNSGYWNSGDRNSGNMNSGYRNSGDMNSGDMNSGYWNSCNFSTGFFNTKTPQTIMVFNKPCKGKRWENATKPNFLHFDLTEWINEADMSEQNKIDHPEFYCQKGYLRTYDYKEAFKRSWDNRRKGDQELLEKLPNFNWPIFTRISGIKKPK